MNAAMSARWLVTVIVSRCELPTVPTWTWELFRRAVLWRENSPLAKNHRR
jgi:hypothetical protein